MQVCYVDGEKWEHAYVSAGMCARNANIWARKGDLACDNQEGGVRVFFTEARRLERWFLENRRTGSNCDASSSGASVCSPRDLLHRCSA